MPKVTRAVADENHIKIKASAARLFTEKGMAEVTVAEVMQAAGMTHGGFYRHYESKVDLATAACRYSFTHTAAGFFNMVSARTGDESALESLLHLFLSQHHRDTPGSGCPVAGYAADMMREEKSSRLKQEYINGVKYVLSEITSLTPGAVLAERQEKAMGVLSTIVGALCISRAVKGDAVSEQFLDAAKKLIKSSV